MDTSTRQSGWASPGLNLDLIRADTPGVEYRIHLNNAGAGLMPNPVLDAIQKHLVLESQIGGYEAAEQAKTETRQAYAAVAELIHTAPQNSAHCPNSTAAFSTALSSIPFVPGDKILTTQDDYVSNQIMFLSMQQRMGVELVRAPNSPDRGADVGQLVQLMDRHQPKLVSVTHIPTNSGLIQPVAEIGQACRERGILYLVDGCQSIGQVEVDVTTIQCDFFTASFRKFLRGPRGIGFLYASDRVLESGMHPLFPDMQGAIWDSDDQYQLFPGAHRFEYWEFPYALVHGA